MAERNTRTVKEMISAMISSWSLGHSYWDHAARYSAVILNKTSLGVDGKDPGEKLTGRKADMQSIRKFSEHRFVQIPKQVRDKSNLFTCTVRTS